MKYLYQDTVDEFIKHFKSIHADDKIYVTGVIVFGSSLHLKSLPVRSDIDLYVIIKNNKKRYRGVCVIKGMEVDYFVNPIEQLRVDFRNAKKSPKRTVIFMLANGMILKDSGKRLSRLQAEARIFLKAVAKSGMSPSGIVFTKYFIEDYLKDIYDNLENRDSFTLHYNIDLLSTLLLETIGQFHHLVTEKPKYFAQKIKALDPRFMKIYLAVKESKNIKNTVKQVAKLSEYVLKKLNGKLPQKWEIKSSSVN